MPWLRYHFHCEACDGSWLAEGDIVVEADCRFCGTRDVFAYKSDDRVHAEKSAAKPIRKPKLAQRAGLRRAG